MNADDLCGSKMMVQMTTSRGDNDDDDDDVATRLMTTISLRVCFWISSLYLSHPALIALLPLLFC